MRERPILFSAPMVRAILDGRKTQTRRISKWPGGTHRMHCPYGVPGDRLWVRETFGFSHQDDDINRTERVVFYPAGGPMHLTDAGVDRLKRCRSGVLMQPNHFVRSPQRMRPSIHMPRWASRLLLEVVDARVERLQAISEMDAIAEGIERMPCSCSPTERRDRCWHSPHGTHFRDYSEPPGFDCVSPSFSFRTLWESINGADAWSANPWVWVVSFRRTPATEPSIPLEIP